MSVHLVEAELEYKNDRITLPLKDDSNGGSGGYMLEIKVAKLETDVGYIKRDIDELRADVKTISQNMAIAIERLDNIRTSLDKKPSTDT
ncbi:hypothetical protein H8L26_26900, partial [Klebsiella pneumoniae]|nr:hypothetical protein [Klebsiella pneumoniae]